MRFTIKVLLVFVFLQSTASAQTQFIPYKKYLIPVSKTTNLFYIDDVDDSRQSGINADPNGVQELPIVVGWKNLGHYNLVGIGAEDSGGVDGNSYNTAFIQSLLTLMGDDTPVTTDGDLRDAIIDRALALGSSGNRLVIAIGGPREIILDAINYAANTLQTPINDRIRVVGIQACLSGPPASGNPPTNCPDYTVGPAIESAVGQENYHIIIDGTPSSAPPSFRWFYTPNAPHISNLNSWYQTHYHQTAVGQYFRDNVSNGYKLDEQNIVLNAITELNFTNSFNPPCANNKCPISQVLPLSNRHIFRGADFTSVAYSIWGGDIWSTEFETRMYTEIEAGLATLP